jgi:histidyl-tRNA synthetase
LEAIEKVSGRISTEGLERYRKNPLRIFDSKDYGEELKNELPVISRHLSQEDAGHFEAVKNLLGATGISFEEDPYLVRGLDYYTRTVFEVFCGKHDAQSALCGGGRYDELVEECGGPPTPAIGFSAGLERIVEALPPDSPVLEERTGVNSFYVVCGDQSAVTRALGAASVLRRFGVAEVDFSGRSIKKQVIVAEKKKARFAVVITSDEDTVVVKDLVEHGEDKVEYRDLFDYVRKQIEKRKD